MIQTLIKLPPRLSVALFFSFITLALIGRFLFRSVLGALVVVLLMYWYTRLFTDIQPYVLGDLLAWFSNLPSDYKVAFLAAFVTITGFAVAFHTATLNWRNQMQAELKSKAAGEIEEFFAGVSKSITTISLYAQDLVELVNRIQNGAPYDEASFRVRFAQGRMNEFAYARNTLSQAAIEVHRLISRNHNILASGWGLLDNTRTAAAALAAVSEAMWIRLPVVDLNDPAHVQAFFNLVNVAECNRLIDVCEASSVKTSGISGGVHGYLLAPIVGFNVPMYWNLLRNREKFLEAVKELRKASNGA